MGADLPRSLLGWADLPTVDRGFPMRCLAAPGTTLGMVITMLANGTPAQ